MCGIAGILLGSSRSRRWLDSIEPMLDTMTHRGPDGAGAWIDRDAGLALGHRRLAIIDLSDAGRQPMLSESRRLVITFNGEIYNFGDIRRELASLGRRFRGGSDTEVMLSAIECWGLDAALRRFAGMFSTFEIGPLGQRPAMHLYTSVVAMFGAPS